MEIFKKLFKKNRGPESKESKVGQFKEKIQLNFSEIREDSGQIYFVINGETDKIAIEEIQRIYEEIAKNFDIPPLIRQGFGIETSAEGEIKVVFHTENYENIEGFVDKAKELLNELKTNLESKLD